MITANAGGNSSPVGVDRSPRRCGSGCVAATNYLARTTEATKGATATNITTLICGLVTDGVITGNLSGAKGCGTHLDALYVFAQQNQADATDSFVRNDYTLTQLGAFFQTPTPCIARIIFTAYVEDLMAFPGKR